jgi:hypothetical protein
MSLRNLMNADRFGSVALHGRSHGRDEVRRAASSTITNDAEQYALPRGSASMRRSQRIDPAARPIPNDPVRTSMLRYDGPRAGEVPWAG